MSCEIKLAEAKRTAPSSATFSACTEAEGGATTGPSYVRGDPGQTAANVTRNVLQGAPVPQNPQQFSMVYGGAIAAGLFAGLLQSALEGPSQEELARRQAARLEQLRLQQEAEERRIRAELERRRILLSSLQGYEGDRASPGLKLEPFAPGNSLLLLGGGGTEIGLGQLKLGDPAPANSALQQLANIGAGEFAPGTRSGFDSAATIAGGLPKPPETPASKPVLQLEDLSKPGQHPKAEVVRVLEEALNTTRGVRESVKADLAKLEENPQRDEAKIKRRRDDLEEIEKTQRDLEDKSRRAQASKDEMVDLSIAETEVAPGAQSSR